MSEACKAQALAACRALALGDTVASFGVSLVLIVLLAAFTLGILFRLVWRPWRIRVMHAASVASIKLKEERRGGTFRHEEHRDLTLPFNGRKLLHLPLDDMRYGRAYHSLAQTKALNAAVKKAAENEKLWAPRAAKAAKAATDAVTKVAKAAKAARVAKAAKNTKRG